MTFFNPVLSGYVFVKGHQSLKVGGVGFFIKNNSRYRVINKNNFNSPVQMLFLIYLINQYQHYGSTD